MLVLSRKKNESIVIGENIKIEVLKVSGNTVRIGIQAPRDIKVLRGELAPWGISSDNNSDSKLNRIREPGVDQEDLGGFTFEIDLPCESGESVSLNSQLAIPS